MPWNLMFKFPDFGYKSVTNRLQIYRCTWRAEMSFWWKSKNIVSENTTIPGQNWNSGRMICFIQKMGYTSNLGKITKFGGGCCRQWSPQRKNRSADRQNRNISLESITIPVTGRKISWNGQYRKAVEPPEDPLMKSECFWILQIPRFIILRFCSHFCLWLFYGRKTLFSSHIQGNSLISGNHLVFHEDHAPRDFYVSSYDGNLKMLLLEIDEIRIEKCIFSEKRKLVWEGKCSLWWLWTSIWLYVTVKLLYLALKK